MNPKSSRKIRVLFVCLGNICRSPMAAAIFQAKVAANRWEELFVIESAGTSGYHEGQPYHPETIAICERRQVPISGRSRPVRSDDFDNFDYIVAMDSSNYQDLLEKCGGRKNQIKKLSHMLEFSELDHVPGLNVPDPYFGGREGFVRVFELLDDACQGLLGRIARDQKLPRVSPS